MITEIGLFHAPKYKKIWITAGLYSTEKVFLKCNLSSIK